MGIGVIGATASSGGTDLNDFSIDITSATTYELDKSYPSGIYSISITNNDTSFDIYAISETNTYCGYTNSATINIASDFNKLSIFGINSGQRVIFYYRGKVAVPSGQGNSVVSGAYISSTSPAAMPNVNSTTIITGGNFSNDVEVYFINSSNQEVLAKNVVKTSEQQLIATRPDIFPISNGPYTIKVVNPGIPMPTGSNGHILTNSVNGGTFPVWITASSVTYNLESIATDIDLIASDTENSTITYSIASGTLPSGLSLNPNTGKISGTFSGSVSEGSSTTIVFRATDAGGNFVDKTINLIANARPIWSAQDSFLGSVMTNSAFSATVSASSNSVGGTIEYSIVSGTLPGGVTLNASTGLISGTPTVRGNYPITVRARELSSTSPSGAIFSDKEFNMFVAAQQSNIDSSQSFTVPANITSILFTMVGGGGHGGGDVGGGGGGGGASRFVRTVSPGQSVVLTVAAGSGTSSAVTNTSPSFNITAPPGNNGGGFGGGGAGGVGNAFTGGSGGNGGNASGTAKNGQPGYTLIETNTAYGGGGGAGQWNSPAGTGGTGGGGAGGVAGTDNTGGGGGGSRNIGAGANQQPGGSGRIILRY